MNNMEYMAYNEIFNSSENLKKSYDYLSSRREELVSFIRDAEPDEIVFLGSGSSYWLLDGSCTLMAKRNRNEM